MSLLSRSPCPCLLTSGFPDADCTTCGGSGRQPEPNEGRDTFGKPSHPPAWRVAAAWEFVGALITALLVGVVIGWIGRGMHQ